MLMFLVVSPWIVAAGDRVLYAMPEMLSPAVVFADPQPWPTPTSGNHTDVVLWHMGQALRLADWDVGAHTGLHDASWALGLPPAEGRAAGPPCGPWAQTTATSIQWRSASASVPSAYGAFLNSACNPPTPASAALTTLIISFDWDMSVAATPWAQTGGLLRWRGTLSVTSAARATLQDAVYSTTSFILRHTASNHVIWYETALFDFERPQADAVFMDTFTNMAIVHGAPLGPLKPSRYHTQAPESASCSNTTWSEPRTFDFTVSSEDVTRGLQDANARFQLGLPTAAEGWAVTHVNVELESTVGCTGGLMLQGWMVSLSTAASPTDEVGGRGAMIELV